MPHRNRDDSGKILPNTPTTSKNQPSPFLNDYELEEPLCFQLDIFEELIWEEEEE